MFLRAKRAIIAAVVDRMRDGVAGGGRLVSAGTAARLRSVNEAGTETGKGRNAATGEGRFWTSECADAAAR